MKSTAVNESLLRSNATHWVTADSNWRTWLLAGAGQADGNTQNSPLMGSLKEKVGQHPILESVLPSYKLICMSALVPLNVNFSSM